MPFSRRNLLVSLCLLALAFTNGSAPAADCAVNPCWPGDLRFSVTTAAPDPLAQHIEWYAPGGGRVEFTAAGAGVYSSLYRHYVGGYLVYTEYFYAVPGRGELLNYLETYQSTDTSAELTGRTFYFYIAGENRALGAYTARLCPDASCAAPLAEQPFTLAGKLYLPVVTR